MLHVPVAERAIGQKSLILQDSHCFSKSPLEKQGEKEQKKHSLWLEKSQKRKKGSEDANALAPPPAPPKQAPGGSEEGGKRLDVTALNCYGPKPKGRSIKRVVPKDPETILDVCNGNQVAVSWLGGKATSCPKAVQMLYLISMAETIGQFDARLRWVDTETNMFFDQGSQEAMEVNLVWPKDHGDVPPMPTC